MAAIEVSTMKCADLKNGTNYSLALSSATLMSVFSKSIKRQSVTLFALYLSILLWLWALQKKKHHYWCTILGINEYNIYTYTSEQLYIIEQVSERSEFPIYIYICKNNIIISRN
jgi:hypothetical protein